MSEFSRKYEMMIIYDEEEKSLDEIKTFVNGVFSANGMTVIDEKDVGLRDYAYPINEKTRGHYYLYHFESEPNALIKMTREFKLYRPIVRQIILKQD